MQITNKQYMRTLLQLILGITVVTFLASCGGKNTLEAKKTKLEKLKASQIELADQIKTLEQEIAGSNDTTTSTKKMKDVIVTKLEPTTFSHSIDVQGRVEGDENVTVVAKMSGSITKLNVSAGSKVKAGQVLAEIEHEVLKAQIADLKTNYELARDLYNKQKSLWEQKVGTEMQYLQAKTNKESLEIKIVQLYESLEMYKILAPFSGTVDEVSIKLGQTVAPGIPAIRVVNLNKLKIKADLAESYSSKIKSGDKVNIIFPDIDKTVTSNVSYTSKVINAMTRTFNVEIALPSSDTYRPNMVAQLGIVDYTKANSLAVPINTVQNIDGKNYVFIAGELNGLKVAQKKEIVVGQIYNGVAEVVSGLTEGDLVITTGYNNLNDNELIKF